MTSSKSQLCQKRRGRQLTSSLLFLLSRNPHLVLVQVEVSLHLLNCLVGDRQTELLLRQLSSSGCSDDEFADLLGDSKV
jgi:hypothetical protein